MKKLYIKTNSLKKHLSLICELALFLDLKYFAVWFYPEAKRKKLSLPFESNFYKEDMLEPITDYDEDQELERVRLYRSFNKRKCTFLQDFKTIEKFVDSICFYKRKKTKWYLCGVMHESMIIAKYSKRLEIYLKIRKIEYDTTPPDWW